MDKQTEQKLLDLKDKYYNCEINDIEYRNSIKKVLGHCSVKILPSKMAQVTFADESNLDTIALQEVIPQDKIELNVSEIKERIVFLKEQLKVFFSLSI